MNPQDPLDALAPLRTPPPVDGWPPAPGWWLLAALALAALAALSVLARRAWRRRAHLRRARRDLAALRERYADDPARLAAAVNALLKRVALVSYPRRDTAALAGEPWLRFLNDSTRGRPFADDSIALPYQSTPAPDGAAAFCEAAEDWLRAQGTPRVAR